MELLRQEMERVGLKEEKGRGGKEQEMMNGNDNKNNNKNEQQQQKTMLRTPADIFDYPSFYSFVLDMPGLDAQNIKVKVEKGILHVTGKKKKQQMGEGVKVMRVERRRARYMRKFTLPADASHEDVKATYKDGVLSITVSKNLQITPQEAEESNSTTSPTIATATNEVSTATATTTTATNEVCTAIATTTTATTNEVSIS